VSSGKSITPRRLARMQGTLARRQPDLTVVIDNVHDPHNVSAMLRSCDAVGAPEAHLLYTYEDEPIVSTGVAASAQRWLTLFRHASVDDCFSALRARGFAIYATTLGEASRELYDLDLTQPSAFVFGNESRGVSPEAIERADAAVFIPMMGMVESLNVSVACAVTLYEALRQRNAAGLYARSGLPPEDIDQQLHAWLLREGRDPGAATVLADPEIPRARNRYEYRG
jgi:tRNA (guanosine-2'-O-)-methyltransferase